MGSLRNPVGPLPSSIYWRRRAVLASVAALLAMLAVWVVTSGDGTSTSDAKAPGGGQASGPAITPGPNPSGSAISQYPGGRDESGSGSGGGDHGGTDAGTGGDASAGAGGSASGSDSGSGKNGDPGGTPAGSGAGVPADSPLPTCAPGAVQWKLQSAKVAYEPTDRPRFDLVATNTSGTTCKVDLGPRTAVLTITKTDADKPVWSSADCPAGPGSAYFRVPAKSSVTHAIEWNRRASAAGRCANPPSGEAAAGTYLVEARAAGLPVLQASFRLDRD
ncbi:hypothetical protein LG634_37105 [Streptomyces bambusae]|uniref:hypothetical protein n=1 Tax=Streptomyces bambusae TaxID=1550616 RepID=UPI001CFFC588|nr:hypothetical protein [Streptomyces bambusae]MCB5170399.1 hypothetical protein [Streptomyces bambusae]